MKKTERDHTLEEQKPSQFGFYRVSLNDSSKRLSVSYWNGDEFVGHFGKLSEFPMGYSKKTLSEQAFRGIFDIIKMNELIVFWREGKL